MGISIVINTLNEEKNLPYTLRSVQWSDEIIVVDMHSTDQTLKIAKQYGAKVFDHENKGFVELMAYFYVARWGKLKSLYDMDTREQVCKRYNGIAESHLKKYP